MPVQIVEIQPADLVRYAQVPSAFWVQEILVPEPLDGGSVCLWTRDNAIMIARAWVAYEAATADIQDFNLVDPFHLAATGQVAINYNRDIEAFPLVRRILERITGQPSIYKSPTDMGVNRAGFGIVDDAACRAAARRA